MSNSSPIIQITNLSKQYRLGQKVAFDTLRERLTGFFKKETILIPKSSDNKIVYALQNFDLNVNAGEVLGIIGLNGAGKSTLLKLISRITPPDTGEIHINGTLSSLLDIGLGFHPDLTGRENIYLNGAIMGMKRPEISAKFNDIVHFSGIEERFLDTPVKRYSSGMFVRLGFAIAAHLESDILLIDEVLAVGDYEFQKKCLNKINDITQSKRTVLFVSHNLSSIQNLCSRTIVIDKGQKVYDGKTNEAIDFYFNLNKRQTQPENLLSPEIVRSGSGKVKFARVEILDEEMQPKSEIATGDSFIIKLDLDVQQPVSNLRVAVTIKDKFGQTLVRLYSKDSRHDFGKIEKNTSILCHVKNLPLNPGSYHLDLWAADRKEVLDLVEHTIDLVIISKISPTINEDFHPNETSNIFWSMNG